MLGLGKHGPDGRYALILDIGSASVGASIVASDIVTDENPILYSRREPAIIRNADTDNPTRAIEEALLQVFLMLGNEGITTLKKYDSSAEISHIQVTVSAPWAHTVSQQAEYYDEKTFKVTDSVIDSLVEKAKKEADKSLSKAIEIKRNGLEMVTDMTLHITTNGYTVNDPRGLETQKLYISHAIGLAPTNLIDAVIELRDKIFPNAQVDATPFMLVYYNTVRDLFPNVTDACLVDITGEATEVGVVRNQELRRVSHAVFGRQTIVRILNEKLKLPDGAVKTLLSNEPVELTKKQQVVFDSLTEEYIEDMTLLFQSMGNILTVPKTVFIHCDAGEEDFFMKHVKTAAERATQGKHTVTAVTRLLFTDTKGHDTAMFLSNYFFHKIHKQNKVKKVK